MAEIVEDFTFTVHHGSGINYRHQMIMSRQATIEELSVYFEQRDAMNKYERVREDFLSGASRLQEASRCVRASGCL